MYPYNRVAQFEVAVYVNGAATGGIIAFKAGKIQKGANFAQNDKKFFDTSKQTYFSSSAVLEVDESGGGGESGSGESGGGESGGGESGEKQLVKNNNNLYIVGSVFLVILLAAYLYWVFKPESTKKNRKKKFY